MLIAKNTHPNLDKSIFLKFFNITLTFVIDHLCRWLINIFKLLFDGSKPITNTWFSKNKSWMCWVVIQFLS